MGAFEAAVLAAIQGATEFLPISSSGHLILAAWLLGWETPSLTFEVSTHVGALAAVVLYFRRDWLSIARGVVSGGTMPVWHAGDREIGARQLAGLVIIGTIPIGIVGLLFRSALEESVRQPTLVGAFLLGTAVIIALGERFGRRAMSLGDVGYRTAVAVGLAQAVAVLPGISRSGASIVAGLLGGMTRETAARFSFFLAVPAILGPGLVLAVELARAGDAERDGVQVLAFAAVVSFVTALAAIRALMALLARYSFRPIAVYCALAGTAVLAARAAGV